MRPTIRDVAEKLKISITTVSRALDGYKDVSEETRILVVRTARQMGYTPNRAARQLRRQRSESIGFILPPGAQHFSEPFFMEFISGLGNELTAGDHDLLVSAAPSEETEREMYRRWVHGGKVDGFILNRLRLRDWRVRFLLEQNIPFATLDHSGKGNYPCIRVDGAQGYVELVQHVHSNGFRRFAFIGGPENLISQVERLDWCQRAIQSAGLVLPAGRIATSDMSSTGGYQAAIELLSLPDPPDAILCINDETAFGVLHAAHTRGLEVGRQLAVAGFEGVQDARYTEPPLTTLDIPVYDIARQLVSMLLKSMDQGTVHLQKFIKPNLLMRASTGG
jgi:LacI family transcriptional regulator